MNESNPKEKPYDKETYMDWYQGKLIEHTRRICDYDNTEIILKNHATRSGRFYLTLTVTSLTQTPINFGYYEPSADTFSTHLCVVPSENSTSIALFVLPKRPDQAKVDRILKWAKLNDHFDISFVKSMSQIVWGDGKRLTEAQTNAIDNIIEKWRIP